MRCNRKPGLSVDTRTPITLCCQGLDRSRKPPLARAGARLPLLDKLLGAIEHPFTVLSTRGCAGYGARSRACGSVRQKPAKSPRRWPVSPARSVLLRPCLIFQLPGRSRGVVHAHQRTGCTATGRDFFYASSIGNISRRSCHPISSGTTHTGAKPNSPHLLK